MLLLNQWAAQVTTRSGMALNIRSVSPSDREELLAFLNSVSPADLRFRFLSAVKPSASLARILTDVDHRTAESLVAFDAADGSIAASAMIAQSEESGAEIAVLVRSDLTGHGIGWKMLEEASRYAQARGYDIAQCVESSSNLRAIEVEREQGFEARPYSGSADITILTKDLR
jgi:acetyltransferase